MNIAYSREGFALEPDDVVFHEGRERRIAFISNGGTRLWLETPGRAMPESVDPIEVTYANPDTVDADEVSGAGE